MRVARRVLKHVLRLVLRVEVIAVVVSVRWERWDVVFTNRGRFQIVEVS
jgi:hypothetical protein